MKLGLILIACLISVVLYGQQRNQLYFPVYQFEDTTQQGRISFLYQYLEELRTYDVDLQPDFERHSQAASHYSYTLHYKQVQLLHACLKLHTDRNGRVISVKVEHPDLRAFDRYNPETELANWKKINIRNFAESHWQTARKINQYSFQLTVMNTQPTMVVELNAWDNHTDSTVVLDKQGNVLFAFDQTRHARIDTLAAVRVFYPDPLTTLNQVYGGTYIDQGDANAAWFGAAYHDTSIRTVFDNLNNTFYLENELVKIEDIESPNAAVATSMSPSFLFNRNQSGFEEVNTLFHITAFHDHIASLGYDTLMKLQVLVDAHAQFGADNSVFNRNGGNPNILFGDGGVDDAEDADVIVHEYCHGISWSANNNSSFTFERAGLDEGLADYFATSYSRSRNAFGWERMFSWDGHNEFWIGRTANTTLNYPNTAANFYATGEIWNAAMSAIWTDLGAIVTDKLMLESLHFFTNSTTLPEAAFYVLQADTILFGGMHTAVICDKFKQKNIFDHNCKPVSSASVFEQTAMKVINTLGFAGSGQDVMVQFQKPVSGYYKLYDVSGRAIKWIFRITHKTRH
jgi:hypothetical protein